ncbi:hypothetical protein ACP4OV_023131 [Aristida adscensionis]
MAERSRTVVLYPGVGVGHLVPMLELAKALRRHGAAVAVALVEPPGEDPAGFSAAVARAKAASGGSVAFHVLPSPPPLPSDGGEPEQEPEHHRMGRMLRFLRAMNAPLRGLLRSLAPPPRALVLDMFCGDALDVAAEAGVPAYFFFPSGAAGLAVFLGLPAARAAMATGFAELGDDAVLSFPGVPPFRASAMPADIADDGAASRAILRMAARMPESRGILINSFESLEPRAVRALRDGRCLPGGRRTPPVYCVGPLVSPGAGGDTAPRHECLRWLDAQPPRSVVFLCFGSRGAFSTTQLEELAAGLERSGQRFFWVVRAAAGDYPGGDPVGLLPAGFLKRTKGRGLAVGSWAPQADVVRHAAAGAFVTHCGWNSTLEGVAAGLPLLCWPLYAEQRLNAVWIVEEMGLGVAVERGRRRGAGAGDDGDGDGDGEDGDGDGEDVVTAEEVAAKVRWVMEDGGARALRECAAAARDRAAAALARGGSSHADFLEFVKDLEASKSVVVDY